MKTKARAKLLFGDIENLIAFNNWLKKNISLYESYDDDEMVPNEHVHQYLLYLKDLVTKDKEGRKVFKRQEWEDKIKELLEDKVGELVGR